MRYALFLIILSLILTGCAGLMQPTAKVDVTAGAQPLPPYSGPKARIAVADFEVKAAKATTEIGSGLREMLITALVNSNRFSVVERQVLDAIMQEQELSVSGAAQPGAVERGKIKTADLIVTAAVTEFEPSVLGTRGGFGGGGRPDSDKKRVISGLLGAALNKAHMALDIRIIDTSTSEVLVATRVKGEASDVFAGFLAGYFGNWALASGLSAYKNTPMEKAIRICIIEAVRYISQTIPADYHRY